MGKYQGYDKYKDSGVEWLGEIPDHWEVKSLRHICEFLNRRRIPLSSEHRGSMSNKIYPYYGASGIIDYVEDFIFNEPTILIAEDGANLLSRSTPLAFIADGEYWVNNHAHILKPFLGEFGYWANLLCIIKYDNWITGSAQPKLTKDNLASIKLPTPPLDEQEKIARFLDYKTKQIDELIAKKETLIEKLDEKRTSLISHAVTKGLDVNVPMKDSGIEWLGDIPESWKIGKLNYFCEIISGGTPDRNNPDFWEGDIPWVKTGEVNYKNIYSTEEYITKEGLNSSSTTLAKPETLLMAMYGQGNTRGRVAILKIEAAFNQACLGIYPLNNLNVYFLYYYLISAYKYIRDTGNESSQMNLSAGLIGKISILTPSLEMQQQIVKFLDQKTAEIEEQKTKIKKAIDLLKEYRTALITNAVTGKIDVRKITIPKI